MYVVGHGTLQVVRGSDVVAMLHDGDCFGELSLIFDSPRQATIVSQGYCDLFKLSRENFQNLVSIYPDLKLNIDRLAAERNAPAPKQSA